MKIGIDISQTAYEKTGVANYVMSLVEHLLALDDKNEYILFFSSMRKDFKVLNLKFNIDNKKIKLKRYKLPPVLLDFLWNRLHIFPIEWFVGDVDIFISSDWTQPPTLKAKKATIIYDVIVYKYPEETDKKIVETQKRRLNWVKKDCDAIFCISESTKKDVHEILGIDNEKLHVTYPGFSL